ncbi:hypothetical protein GFL24_36530, partial [Rhizobium laguerreae]|nr:hypothetical protein [Rhizobium laguerreae]
VLTDNGIQFCDLPSRRNGPTARLRMHIQNHRGSSRRWMKVQWQVIGATRIIARSVEKSLLEISIEGRP